MTLSVYRLVPYKSRFYYAICSAGLKQEEALFPQVVIPRYKLQ